MSMHDEKGNSTPDWISRSRIIAERLGHHYISPEHVFLAIAGAEKNQVQAILNQLGCDVREPAEIIMQIMTHVDAGQPGINIPLTRATERMLKNSYLEARNRHNKSIQDIDVLLGMLQDKKSVISMVLNHRFNVAYENVRLTLGS